MTFDKVKNIIVEQTAVDDDEITPGASLQDDLGCDSLDAVTILMAIEEEFGIEIPDDDALSIKTVQGIVDYIDKLMAEKK